MGYECPCSWSGCWWICLVWVYYCMSSRLRRRGRLFDIQIHGAQIKATSLGCFACSWRFFPCMSCCYHPLTSWFDFVGHPILSHFFYRCVRPLCTTLQDTFLLAQPHNSCIFFRAQFTFIFLDRCGNVPQKYSINSIYLILLWPRIHEKRI